MAKGKKVKAMMSGSNVISSASEALNLFSRRRFGEIVRGKVKYLLVEALYLIEEGMLEVYDGGKKVSKSKFLEKAGRFEKDFLIRYLVFSDLRSKGYLVKTALKYGADFRVYEKGNKIGKDHAKWIVFPAKEGKGLTWRGFAAKSRVAHSTRKNLLIAIVDGEGDVTYYSVDWTKI
ncbi:tRNA-intron lyase [Nanoarchaeota archaeon]